MSDMTIVSVKSGLSEYNTGESVNLVITIRNDDLPAVTQIRIYNRITGKLIQGFGSFLLTNEQFDYTRSIGAMPDDNLKLTITANGRRKDFEVQLIGAELVTPEIVEEEKIEEEIDVTPKEEVFKEDIIYRPDIYRIGEVKVSGLPWYVSWLQPLANFFGAIAEGVTNHFGVVFTPIYEFFQDPIGTITKGFSEIASKGTSESIKSSLSITKIVGEGSPDWLVDLRTNIDTLTRPLIMELNKAIDVKTYEKSILSPKDASIKLNELRTNLIIPSLAMFGIHAGIESASLGQFEWFRDIEPMVMSKLGINTIMQRATLLPIEKAILIPAEQHYNYMYTPLIPTYTDLINMVVKEKITLPTFKMYMRLQGYSADFAQLIWDSHFIAPSLGHLLTSFRRGTITEEQLTKLQVLVDLDPLYNEIWFDQRYHDPTPRQARWMFEAGAIDIPRVKNIVERTGLLPEDVEPFTQYLITFNERQWKRRYILEVARGYRLDKVTEAELRKEVIDVYHSEGVADWIVKTEEQALITEAKEPKPPKVRLLSIGELKRLTKKNKLTIDGFKGKLSGRDYSDEDINLMVSLMELERKEEEIKYSTEELVEGIPKPKVLNLGDLKKAYLVDKLDEDELRSRLMGRGYDLLDIDLLIELLNEEKVIEVKPTKPVSLSVSQLLNAFRYNEIDEDELKAKLLDKNMDMLDIIILINSKKKQWGYVE